jgi:hypothetical protein
MVCEARTLDIQTLTLVIETDPSEYSIASAFSLTHYEQVMILPTPSLILNSHPLDSILADHTSSEYLSLYPSTNTISSENLLIITPSKDMHETIRGLRTEPTQTDSVLLKKAFPSPPVLSRDTDPAFSSSLYATLESLRKQQFEDRFNATAFLQKTALFRIEDHELPGPQYDAPYQDVVNLRPKDEDQGFIWENLYSTYKDRRYKVCGLNPMPWPPR